MAPIPRESSRDATLALLREGYRFIGNRSRRLGSDLFRTRLLLRPVVCMTGREAAALLYDADRFTRRGAVPGRVQKLLQDEGSVQSLDDAAHRRRKKLFMDMMSPAGIDRLDGLFRRHWRAAAARWPGQGQIVLHDEARRILCAASCEWVGVPIERPVGEIAEELGAMIDGTAAVGPRHWRARRLRRRNERWVADLVDRARDGSLALPPGSPLESIVRHRDDAGRPLARSVAAVEVINLLRPTLAVARFIAYAALQLHEHPAWAARLRAGGPESATDPESAAELEAFVQEVRRLCPFFPAIGGVARRDFEWRGHRFRRGDWALLDLFGTNRDARLWDEPERFRPERFLGRAIGPDELVPQGGGDPYRGHRCPGEWIAIALLKSALRELLALDWTLPPQDLSIDLRKAPALPASGILLAARGPMTRPAGTPSEEAATAGRA